MSKISRGQKGEELVIKELNNIKEYHHLLNNVTLINKKTGMSHQLDHVLVHPHGVFVIETKNYYGEILYKNNAWYRNVKGTKTKISNPLLQNKSHAVTLYYALKKEYIIIPVEVFVQNNAPYFPDDNVINLNDLILFIESYPYEHKYTKATIDKIFKKLNRCNVEMDVDEHVQNINLLKEYRKEQQAEMTYAIEQKKCPWCESPLDIKGYHYKCPKCKFEFKL